MPPWRQDDYAASKFIKALKGRPVNGYAWVPSGLGPFNRFRLTQQTQAEAFTIFARRAAPILAGVSAKKPIALVPVPNRHFTVDWEGDCRTSVMAGLLLTALGAGWQTDTFIRWQFEIEPGNRDADELYLLLSPLKYVSTAANIVLVDDVLTSGAHMKASARRASEAGLTIVAGIAAGRADQGYPPEPFGVRQETVNF